MDERNNAFRAIDDWSLEGREKLVAERGDEIRMLLDDAFSNFADEAELGPFGFHGRDPVAEAADYALTRFGSLESLDPLRLEPACRSFAIFARADFWLSQKGGQKAYLAKRSRKPQAQGSDRYDPREDGTPLEFRNAALSELADGLAGTASVLHARTCHDMVSFWFAGTERWRAEWFGWTAGEAPTTPSAKVRSERIHDALFRFCVLFLGGPSSDELALEAATATHFSPCKNAAPYRVADRDIAAAWGPQRVDGPRRLGQLRKLGLATMLATLCAGLASRPGAPVELLRWTVLRRSISLTTLHALEIQDATNVMELKALITELPKWEDISDE